jgi:arginase
MPSRLALLGVPTSAGAFAPGQERAPRELRRAGLVERLRDSGVEVNDLGDSEVWRWRPDPGAPRAQNLGVVRDIVRDTARRVERALADGAGPLLVLGGDCTIELGTVAGHLARNESVGLVYFDLHPDLNTPDSARPGALDWMGVAHMLGEPGVAPELSGLGTRDPMLRNDEVLFFAYGPEQATEFERGVLDRRGLERMPVDDVAAGPEAAAARALSEFGSRFDRLLVHFDVDVIDFTDAPLSENTGRNEGLALDVAMRALAVLAASERLSALTVTELNPLHGDEEGRTLGRFVDSLVGCLRAAGQKERRGPRA